MASTTGSESHDQLIADLEAHARPLGLYLESASIEPNPMNPDEMLVLAHFLVGERAFKPVVQDPDSAKFDEQFRGIKVDMEAEQDAENERLFREGKLGWKPEDEA